MPRALIIVNARFLFFCSPRAVEAFSVRYRVSYFLDQSTFLLFFCLFAPNNFYAILRILCFLLKNLQFKRFSSGWDFLLFELDNAVLLHSIKIKTFRGLKKVMSSEDISPGSLKAKDKTRTMCDAWQDRRREIACDQQGYKPFRVRKGFVSVLQAAGLLSRNAFTGWVCFSKINHVCTYVGTLRQRAIHCGQRKLNWSRGAGFLHPFFCASAKGYLAFHISVFDKGFLRALCHRVLFESWRSFYSSGWEMFLCNLYKVLRRETAFVAPSMVFRFRAFLLREVCWVYLWIANRTVYVHFQGNKDSFTTKLTLRPLRLSGREK